jgi:hypothetical protein
VRHVILEGPDGAGKTTLARQLCDTYGYGYHHEGPPPEDVAAVEHYGGLLTGALSLTVFDRLHLGELVYGPLLRGRCRLNTHDLEVLSDIVLRLNITTVICLPPWTTCLENTRAKREMIEDEAVLHQAYRRWVAIDDHPCAVNVVHFDYTSPRSFAQLKEALCVA